MKTIMNVLSSSAICLQYTSDSFILRHYNFMLQDTENLKEQFIMAITLTPKPEASTSNYPKNIGIVITGLGNIAAALLCPPWLDLRAESRLSPLYTRANFRLEMRLYCSADFCATQCLT